MPSSGLRVPEYALVADVALGVYQLRLELNIGLAADEVQTLVLVGHNPSMHGLAITLSDGEGDPAAEIGIRAEYPTCGIAIFDVAGSWVDLDLGTATVRRFDAPRG